MPESRNCPITSGAVERKRLAVDNKEAYKLDKEQGSKVGVKRMPKDSMEKLFSLPDFTSPVKPELR